MSTSPSRLKMCSPSGGAQRLGAVMSPARPPWATKGPLRTPGANSLSEGPHEVRRVHQ